MLFLYVSIQNRCIANFGPRPIFRTRIVDFPISWIRLVATVLRARALLPPLESVTTVHLHISTYPSPTCIDQLRPILRSAWFPLRAEFQINLFFIHMDKQSIMERIKAKPSSAPVLASAQGQKPVPIQNFLFSTTTFSFSILYLSLSTPAST